MVRTILRWRAWALVVVLSLASAARAADKVEFTEETLDNGLRVIYAPLRQVPVVHVRVFYHVGSKNERPDRTGFAHMFEHMMFRGSEHVTSEQHGKLISMVGGHSNAFTSFDQTVYVNTVPSNQTELAMYLEADRMASFKVSESIFDTERKVIIEEWGRQQNQPYGTMFQDFLKMTFTTHSYRWAPIGDMDHLRASTAADLQDFFNTYYVPNNAVLVIAGDFNADATKAMVRKYFGWIPKGNDVPRNIPAEPAQIESRRSQISRAVPLAAILIGFHVPGFKSDDHYALSVLGSILGDGNSSRLDQALVAGENPLCTNVSSGVYALEDSGGFILNGIVMVGKDPDEVEKIILKTVNDLIEKGVTDEELAKARTAAKVQTVRGRHTAESVAGQLAQEKAIGGDASRVNTELDKINALTVQDIQAVAKKYLRAENSNTLRILPDLKAMIGLGQPPTSQPTTAPAPSSRPVSARAVQFPADYPSTPPLNTAPLKPQFQKGTETTINGVKVIVMPDTRLPLVQWSLALRQGSDAEAPGQEGLSALTSALIQRGAAGMSYLQFSKDLDGKGISIDVSDGGDTTRISGSSLTELVEDGILRTRQVLREPNLDAGEFDRLKQQSLSELTRSLQDPDAVAGREIATALYGSSRFGRSQTPDGLKKLSLDDVKEWYKKIYRPRDAILVISGDVNLERGQALAKKLLDGWDGGVMPTADYTFPEPQKHRRIIVIDRPAGRQSMIRMRLRSYSLKSDDRFAGSVAGQVLSAGMDSRLTRYVRAERGLAYSVWAAFQPTRHAGSFTAGTETSFKTTADAIEAMMKVFADLREGEPTAEEMKETKLRVWGSLLMDMQTIQQQATMRINGILNGYPADYYEKLPQRYEAIMPAEVRDVMNKYVKDELWTIVVVAPATEVVEQLKRLGDVEILPMPLERQAATQPAQP